MFKINRNYFPQIVTNRRCSLFYVLWIIIYMSNSKENSSCFDLDIWNCYRKLFDRQLAEDLSGMTLISQCLLLRSSLWSFIELFTVNFWCSFKEQFPFVICSEAIVHTTSFRSVLRMRTGHLFFKKCSAELHHWNSLALLGQDTSGPYSQQDNKISKELEPSFLV